MSNLKPGFVYLEDFAPTIQQDIRYAQNYNLIGRPIAGYGSERCVITEPLAKALAAAQEDANAAGYSLKVYEAYRPLRAGEDIQLWCQDPAQQSMKEEYYKHIDKATLHAEGYVLMRSFHTRGAAVDVTLIPLDKADYKKYQSGDALVDGILPYAHRLYDNSIDMGTAFDCFHDMSHTWHKGIPEVAANNRKLLCTLMEKHGFENYEYEWWHFNFKDEPFPETYFDFEIR